MKRIDTHSHVIPESIIDAMRAQPDLYKTKITGERGKYLFTRGKITFDLIAEFYDAAAKVESMDRKGIDISYISPGPQTFFYGLGPDHALKTAQIELKSYSAQLAVDLARKKVRDRMTAADQDSLVQAFTADLGGSPK